MKISYMALVRQCTIRELFLEGILASYKSHAAAGLPVKEFPLLEKKFFIQII